MSRPFKTIKRPDELPVEQGEIYFVDLPKQYLPKGDEIGTETFGEHRCLVLQSWDTTKELNHVIVVPISSAKQKAQKASWVEIPGGTIPRLPKRSYILCEEVRSIDRRRIESFVGKLDAARIHEVQRTLDFLCPSILDSFEE